ncbi:hypothetical protein CR513_14693, partial [Mucuna pruriens]
MKPFRESYKFFKDHFFRVLDGRIRSSLLFGESRDPLFPLYWSDQPTFSVTVDRDNLEDCEEEFIEDLNQLPTLSYSKFITDKGYFIKDFVVLKMCSSRSTTPAVGGAVVEAFPLFMARPIEENVQSPPVVVVDSTKDSTLPTNAGVGNSSAKRVAEEGVLQSQEQPSKRMLMAGGEASGVVDFYFGLLGSGFDRGEADDGWTGVMASRPLSHSIGTLGTRLARAIELEFKSLAAQQQALVKENRKATTSLMKLSAEYAEA